MYIVRSDSCHPTPFSHPSHPQKPLVFLLFCDLLNLTGAISVTVGLEPSLGAWSFSIGFFTKGSLFLSLGIDQ